MQTVVAYAFDQLREPRAVHAGLRRVEEYYASAWSASWRRDGRDVGTVGLHVWDRTMPTCRWPSWWADPDLSVATLYVPLGYARVLGEIAPEAAPGALARALQLRHDDLLELTAPFVLLSLSTTVGGGRLDMFTDLMGVGRLFQLRTSDGWVWSNRPAAACLFAGEPASPSVQGWRYQAGITWSMADSTPYEGVLAVPGGSWVTYDGGTRQRGLRRLDPGGVWASWHRTGERRGALRVTEAVSALQDCARSIATVFPGRPVVDLSGGRDSRVVAAAFLSAGVDCQLHSHDAVPGEVEVAQALVASLGGAVDHVVRRAGGADPGAAPSVDALERVLQWHRFSEGLRPASFFWHVPPADLTVSSGLAIGGAGGEIAHGRYYPADIPAIDGLPLDRRLEAYADRLTSRLVAKAGPSERARAAVHAQCLTVLREAAFAGFGDATVLDYFWAAENLRRWGMTGERLGIVSPLLATDFVRSGFALTPAQRQESALHRAVLQATVPQWAEIPFFTPPRRREPAPVRRLAVLARDHAAVANVFEQPARWGEDFDVDVVRQLWDASGRDETSAAEELILLRVLWREVFDDHLREVNGHLGTTVVPEEPVPLPDVEGVVALPGSSGARGIRSTGIARLLARTPAGRWIPRHWTP